MPKNNETDSTDITAVDVSDVDSTKPDVDAYQAKIDQLNADLAARDALIAERDSALSAAKAANYDLLVNGPGNQKLDDTATVVDDLDNDTDISIDDFFKG